MLLGSLGLGACLSCPGLAHASRLDILKPIINPSLRLIHLNTNDRISTTFWRDGNYIDQELRRINAFMRDWREGIIRVMDPDLLWALAAISDAAIRDGHSGEIFFLSGYRTKKTNDMLRRRGYRAAHNSFHLRAQAVDFVLSDIPVRHVSKYARWLEIGGVGYYPENFVHIDTGRIRYWVG